MTSRPDWIFENHQLWQSGLSSVYSGCCCSCSFEPEIIRISQSFHKMYSNNILNFQVSMTILNAWTKKSGNLLNARCIFLLVYFCWYIFWVVCLAVILVGKWKQRSVSKSQTRLIAFHIVLMPLRKTWILLFWSLLWLNSTVDYILLPKRSNQSWRRKTLNSNQFYTAWKLT